MYVCMYVCTGMYSILIFEYVVALVLVLCIFITSEVSSIYSISSLIKIPY